MAFEAIDMPEPYCVSLPSIGVDGLQVERW
jgi:hypothetical protein